MNSGVRTGEGTPFYNHGKEHQLETLESTHGNPMNNLTGRGPGRSNEDGSGITRKSEVPQAVKSRAGDTLANKASTPPNKYKFEKDIIAGSNLVLKRVIDTPALSGEDICSKYDIETSSQDVLIASIKQLLLSDAKIDFCEDLHRFAFSKRMCAAAATTYEVLHTIFKKPSESEDGKSLEEFILNIYDSKEHVPLSEKVLKGRSLVLMKFLNIGLGNIKNVASTLHSSTTDPLDDGATSTDGQDIPFTSIDVKEHGASLVEKYNLNIMSKDSLAQSIAELTKSLIGSDFHRELLDFAKSKGLYLGRESSPDWVRLAYALSSDSKRRSSTTTYLNRIMRDGAEVSSVIVKRRVREYIEVLGIQIGEN